MISDRETLVIRADASVRLGIGHVMRCLALAQAWQGAGGRTLFVLGEESHALATRLTTEGMEVAHISVELGGPEDVQQTASVAKQRRAGWVAVDGYHFGAEYQRAIKDAALSLLFVDDYGHAAHYSSDLVLNQNISADESLYTNRAPYTRLLLGPRYALLRREFWSWHGWHRNIPDVARRVLVTLGGADPENVTLRVIRVLQGMGGPGLEAKIVIGPANPHLDALRGAAWDSGLKLEFLMMVDNMPELMAWADVSVSGGGVTCWELAFMGTPNCIVVLSENQAVVAARFHEYGAAINAGWFASVDRGKLMQELWRLIKDKKLRSEMSYQGKRLVHGDGSQRVVEAMLRQTG